MIGGNAQTIHPILSTSNKASEIQASESVVAAAQMDAFSFAG
jgi:hypothetical protein